jgi:hypothetical protein
VEERGGACSSRGGPTDMILLSVNLHQTEFNTSRVTMECISSPAMSYFALQVHEKSSSWSRGFVGCRPSVKENKAPKQEQCKTQRSAQENLQKI